MYSENHPLERKKYLRRALGDRIYERLEELTMKELIYEDHDWRCPNCKYRVDGWNVDNHPQVECPRCKTISLFHKSIADNIPESEFKGRLQAQLNQSSESGLDDLNSHKKTLYNTGPDTKRKNWSKFASLIENQFKHGGEKYLLDNQKDKEFTDLVCEVSPGKTGIDWILQTCVKYIGRYLNFQRERDLLKIATYCYIAWLKAGHHLNEEHDEDTQRSKKDVEEITSL